MTPFKTNQRAALDGFDQLVDVVDAMTKGLVYQAGESTMGRQAALHLLEPFKARADRLQKVLADANAALTEGDPSA